jgi:hypothetical protein
MADCIAHKQKVRRISEIPLRDYLQVLKEKWPGTTCWEIEELLFHNRLWSDLSKGAAQSLILGSR